MQAIKLGELEFANDKPVALFGGMNVLESRDLAMQVAEAYGSDQQTGHSWCSRPVSTRPTAPR